MKIATAARRLPIVLVAVLIVLWLVLNQTIAPGHILLAVIVAVVLAWATSGLRPLRPALRNPHTVAALLVMVLIDIVHANIGVARIVLGPVRGLRSAYLDIPLELRDPHGLAALAMIVTSTPGTVWVDLAADQSRLTLHVLDLEDEAAMIHRIKSRYEQPLMRIFE